MSKQRQVVYLNPATVAALGDYRARHRDRHRTLSEAVDHLLQRALLGAVDEGLEGLLVPRLERTVETAAARAVEARVAPLLRAQTDRLAGLLVKSGKDALGAYTLATALLEQVMGDPSQARRIAEDARLKAGAAYTARGVVVAAED